MTIESIDNFTKVLTKDLPKIDYDTAADGVTAFLNSQIRGGQQIYKTTKDKLWDELGEGVAKSTIRADGSYNPAYLVKIRPAPIQTGQKIIIDSKGGTGTVFGFNKANTKLGNMNDNYIVIRDKALYPGANKKMVLSKEIVEELNSTVKPKINVHNSYKGKDELVDNLNTYIKKATKENIVPDNPDVQTMLGILNRMGNDAEYNTFRTAYAEIAGMRPVGRAQSVQAEIQKRMEAMLATSPLPASVNAARRAASDFTRLGGRAFEGKVVSDLLKTDFGQERLYKNIIGAGKPSYFRAFQKSLKDAKINAGGKKYDLFSGKIKTAGGVVPDRTAIQGALQGQFFKDFLRSSVDKSGQYYKLSVPKAEKFMKDYDWLFGNDPKTGLPVGFLKDTQIKGIKGLCKKITIN